MKTMHLKKSVAVDSINWKGVSGSEIDDGEVRVILDRAHKDEHCWK